jgi:hypothetical protein
VWIPRRREPLSDEAIEMSNPMIGPPNALLADREEE